MEAITKDTLLTRAMVQEIIRAIDQEADKNEEANYFNGLIDGGEWSQQAPDFSKVVKRFSLTTETVECLVKYVSSMEESRRIYGESEFWMNAYWCLLDVSNFIEGRR